MTTLYYLTNSKLPTEKAFGYGISKMCEAFGEQLRVVLVVPRRKGTRARDVFSYYGVKQNFEIKTVWSMDLFRYERLIGKLAYGVQAITYLFSVLFTSFEKGSILYSRDMLLLPFLRLRTPNVFLEIHFLQPQQKRMAWVLRFAKKLITTTAHLKESIASFGYPRERIVVAHDAVDLPAFAIDVPKIDARRQLGLPEDRVIIGYTGNYKAMGVDKGIESVMRALPALRQRVPRVLFVAVGGMPADIEEYSGLAVSLGVRETVCLVPRVHVRELPLYQQAFDVLVMCPPRTEYFSYHVSPLKMFEYMASHRPIVASDLPGFHEVLTDANAIFVDGENPESVAEGVTDALTDKDRSTRLADQAFRDVQDFTWAERARRILAVIM